MPPKSFQKGNVKKRLVHNFTQGVLSGVEAIGLVLQPLEPQLISIGKYNNAKRERELISTKTAYNKLAANERESKRIREEVEANKVREIQEAYINAQSKNAAQKLMKKRRAKLAHINHKSNDSAGTSSSVQHSIERLLSRLPSLEPIVESTPSFSQRKEERERANIKRAAAKTKKLRKNIVKISNNKSSSNENNVYNLSKIFGVNGNGSRSRSDSKSSLNRGHSSLNVNQERKILGSLLESPQVVLTNKNGKNNSSNMNNYLEHLFNERIVNQRRVRKEKLATNLNEINRKPSVSRLRKEINKAKIMNTYYNPNVNENNA